MTLTELAIKYGTDKLDHGYLPHYERLLPKKVRSMLEIGIAKGASAQMWLEYYKGADLHYIDLFQSEEHVTPMWCRERFIVPHVGDQSNLGFLGTIYDKFDLIIDDGSHNAHHQLLSFKGLFLNNLNSGGLYIIEDCHCNQDPFYWGGEVKSYEDTPIAMAYKFIENNKINNPYFNEGESLVFENIIEEVFTRDGKLIFIHRK